MTTDLRENGLAIVGPNNRAQAGRLVILREYMGRYVIGTIAGLDDGVARDIWKIEPLDDRNPLNTINTSTGAVSRHAYAVAEHLHAITVPDPDLQSFLEEWREDEKRPSA